MAAVAEAAPSGERRTLTRSEVRTLALAALGGALEYYDFIIFVYFAIPIGRPNGGCGCALWDARSPELRSFEVRRFQAHVSLPPTRGSTAPKAPNRGDENAGDAIDGPPSDSTREGTALGTGRPDGGHLNPKHRPAPVGP